MIRLLPFFIGCFAAPILAYAFWILATGYNPLKCENWQGAPWRWMLIIGCTSLVFTFMTFNHYDIGSPPSEGYAPARMENGKLIQAK